MRIVQLANEFLLHTGCDHALHCRGFLIEADSQCYQGAKISAAELKRGPTKICAAGKIGGQIFFEFAKKGPKRGRPFLKMISQIK
jgi:hypothetical protein